MPYLETNLPNKKKHAAKIILGVACIFLACAAALFIFVKYKETAADFPTGFSYSDIPEYNGGPVVEINSNTPLFTSDEIADKAFES